MTHFISGGRLVGKTRRMIEMSAETGAYIVCLNRREAGRVWSVARELDVNMPFPITWSEFAHGDYYAPGIRGFLIDNLDQCVQGMSRVPILGATLPAVECLPVPRAGVE